MFAGGWTVDAAEAACADLADTTPGAASVLDGLAALLDASLISEMTSAGEPRCAMLETVREYVYEQLVAHGELARTQELHAHYVGVVASQAASELSGPAQSEWLQRLDADLDNLRTALRWHLEDDLGGWLRLASNLNRFWDVRGHRREGRAWVEALLVAGMLASFLFDFAPATKHLRASMGLYQQLEDQQNIARILNNLGNIALQQGLYPQAEQHYRESLALRHEINHTLGTRLL